MRRVYIERKDRLHESFIAALDRLDAEGREPDRWEEECLSYALGAMACSMYLVAEVELDAFHRPPAERSPDAVAALAARPRRFTKEMLRSGLEYVQSRYADASPPNAVPPALAASRLAVQSSLLS